MVLANLYYHRFDSNSDFCSQNSVSLSALQPAITAPCLFSSVVFDLCSNSTLLPQPLKSSIRPGNRCPWAIIITLILFGQSKDSNSDFCSQNSVSLSALQPAITAPCLFSSVVFDLCSNSTLLPQPLKSSIRPGNRCPWAIIITLILFGQSKATY